MKEKRGNESPALQISITDSNKKLSKDSKNDGPKIIYKVKFNLEGVHYAEIDNFGFLRFVKYKNGKYEIVSHVETFDPENDEKKIIIAPAPQIGQTKDDRIFDSDKINYIRFPNYPEPYDSEFELYKEVKAFIHEYVELPPDIETLVSLYVMKASLFDALKVMSLPFIHIIAPFGKGKSRILTVMCEITPYGFYTVDIKSAGLKRVSELYEPVVFVDEKLNIDQELAGVINGKYNRNSVILNANLEIQKGYSSVVGMRIFGPLVIASRTPFRDDAIESKSFQINLDQELERKDIPKKIEKDIYDKFLEKGAEIRNKMLMFRIKYHDMINSIKPTGFLKEYEDKVEPRLYEIISYFEDIAELIPEVKNEIIEMVMNQIIHNVEVANETPNGIVASTFLNLIDSEEEDPIEYESGGKWYKGIPLYSLYAEVGENYSKQTGKILNSLGLKTDRPRKTIKTEEGEEKKKRITVVRIPDERKINELRSRYDPQYIKSVLLRIKQGSQASLDDEDEEDDEKNIPPSENDKNIIQNSNNPESPDKIKKEEDDTSQNDSPDSPHRPIISDTTLSLNDSPHRPLRPNMLSEPEKSQSPDINPCVKLALEDIKTELKAIIANNGNIMTLSIFSNVLNEKLKARCPDLSDSELREAFRITNQWPEFSFDYNSQIVTLEEIRR